MKLNADIDDRFFQCLGDPLRDLNHLTQEELEREGVSL